METKINNSATYSINADRIKEIARKTASGDKKSTPISLLWQKTPLFSERAFRRNLSQGIMKGETLLAISKALDCTPYYFMEPSPMGDFLTPLKYWHYEIQELSMEETRYKFFLARNLAPDKIKRISPEDIERIETLAQEIIDKYEN